MFDRKENIPKNVLFGIKTWEKKNIHNIAIANQENGLQLL